MLHHYRRTLSRVSPDLRRNILAYFALPPVVDPLDAVLGQRGYGQADLVLALLRVNSQEARRITERIIGHRITICPPCLQHARRPVPRASLSVNEHDHVVVKITENPFQGGRRARFARLRAGMTYAQYVARGGVRRDLRVAVELGAIKIRSAA